MTDAERVQKLIAIAMSSDAARDRSAILGYVVRHVADQVATRGTLAAIAWTEGYWYGTGNRDPRNHATLSAIQFVLDCQIVTDPGRRCRQCVLEGGTL